MSHRNLPCLWKPCSDCVVWSLRVDSQLEQEKARSRSLTERMVSLEAGERHATRVLEEVREQLAAGLIANVGPSCSVCGDSQYSLVAESESSTTP